MLAMPLNSSLITGAQSLFGVKALNLQFGKTTSYRCVSLSRRSAGSNSVVAQGGGTLEEFELFGLEITMKIRHFFLSQYFRDTYDEALLKTYPYINNKGLQITRIRSMGY